MKIALLGFGTVGGGVYELLRDRPEMRVLWVLCRRDRQLEGCRVTHDISDILDDPSVETVVEAMGGLHPAFEYVKAAMERGKNVVSANKAMIAAYYRELMLLAGDRGVSFRCTAAVGGGVPWLCNLERARRWERIREVSGILNGTCNYILDRMTRYGLSYEAALAEAQALGYAEADPGADVEGWDTRNKLVISANRAFGLCLDPGALFCRGISAITPGDVEAFRLRGYTCKLMGLARRTGAGVEAWVLPTLVAQDDMAAWTPLNNNLISMELEGVGVQSFYGQGAGRAPTAYNVAQDCTDLLLGRGFNCEDLDEAALLDCPVGAFYLREGPDAPGVFGEDTSLERLRAWAEDHPRGFLAIARPRRQR